jgi:hypothetical protein
VVGVVQVDILKGLLGLECATARCPHCSKVNTFPGFAKMSAYVCAECGEAVGATEPASTNSELKWTQIRDDTCTWYEFDDGREPIAVMRCCGGHPDADGDGVVCPHPQICFKSQWVFSHLAAMDLCAHRQSLVDMYEAALDEYLASLKHRHQGHSDSPQRHADLLRRRAALVEHCIDHGCGTAMRASEA